jgi:hypothetical protein
MLRRNKILRRNIGGGSVCRLVEIAPGNSERTDINTTRIP